MTIYLICLQKQTWKQYCKIKFLEESGIAKRQTASIYLKELERIGILRGFKMGRDVYYVNDLFLKALTTL